jgi:hypothetical protein
MYIIGGDGKEYGPVAPETIRQWLAEGRVDYRTRVRNDADTEWRTLAEFPELTGATPPPQQPAPHAAVYPPPAAPQFHAAPNAAEQVNGPAIGLMITAILGGVLQVLGIVGNLLGASFGARSYNSTDAFAQMLTGGVAVVFGIIAIAMAGLILFGAMKMKKLEAHGWAMAASIIALIPCVSPCCFIGLPIGIWALIVLAKPEVKAAFH